MVSSRIYKRAILESIENGEIATEQGTLVLNKRAHSSIADSLYKRKNAASSNRSAMQVIAAPRPKYTPPEKPQELKTSPEETKKENKSHQPQATEVKQALIKTNKAKDRIELLKKRYQKHGFGLFFIFHNQKDVNSVSKNYIHITNKQINTLLGKTDKERIETANELAHQIDQNDNNAVGVLDACVEYLVANCYLFDDDFDNIDNLNLIDQCETIATTLYIFIQDTVKNIRKTDVSNDIHSKSDVYPGLSQPIYSWLLPFVLASAINFKQNLKP